MYYKFLLQLQVKVWALTRIRSWIKNNAGWWAEGAIDDDTFIQGIQFLIKKFYKFKIREKSYYTNFIQTKHPMLPLRDENPHPQDSNQKSQLD